MQDTNVTYLKSLPKIEVSFQDDFSGAYRDLYSTPGYVLRKLDEMKVIPSFGTDILFWEKDELDNGEYHFICNIGQISEATEEILKPYQDYGHILSNKELAKLQGKPILITLEKEGFSLPSNTFVFDTVR